MLCSKPLPIEYITTYVYCASDRKMKTPKKKFLKDINENLKDILTNLFPKNKFSIQLEI